MVIQAVTETHSLQLRQQMMEGRPPFPRDKVIALCARVGSRADILNQSSPSYMQLM